MTPLISEPHGRRPFFWFGHKPGGGGVLGPDQPLVVLSTWPALYHMPDIERLSGHFVEEIQAIQAEGPYFLGGDCYNGFVAYEVARKLAASGQEIPLLVMMKPCHPSEYTLRQRIVRRVLLSILHPTTLVRFALEKYRRLPRGAGEFLMSHQDPSKQEVLAALFAQHAFKSVESYVQKKPYPGRVTLIVIDRMRLRFLLRPTWRKLARGGVDVHVERFDTWEELVEGPAVTARIAMCIDAIVRSQSYRERFATKGREGERVPV